jgi:hypothetical protein
MHEFRSWVPVVPAALIFAAFLAVQGSGPGVANAAPQAGGQSYAAKFECAIAPAAADCSAAADNAIPAGRRLKIESVKARIVVPSRVKAPLEFFIDVGDPGAPGGVRSIKATPTQSGRTEGGFFAIWAVDERVEGFAYRTEKFPAPKFRLSSPEHDPLKLLNGAVQDGVVGGSLVGLE